MRFAKLIASYGPHRILRGFPASSTGRQYTRSFGGNEATVFGWVRTGL